MALPTFSRHDGGQASRVHHDASGIYRLIAAIAGTRRAACTVSTHENPRRGRGRSAHVRRLYGWRHDIYFNVEFIRTVPVAVLVKDEDEDKDERRTHRRRLRSQTHASMNAQQGKGEGERKEAGQP